MIECDKSCLPCEKLQLGVAFPASGIVNGFGMHLDCQTRGLPRPARAEGFIIKRS